MLCVVQVLGRRSMQRDNDRDSSVLISRGSSRRHHCNHHACTSVLLLHLIGSTFDVVWQSSHAHMLEERIIIGTLAQAASSIDWLVVDGQLPIATAYR
jgi:hypothetical protein